LVDGVHQIFATIEGVVYCALLDIVSAISSASVWVFDQIKIAIEDLIAWSGFLFGWKDILRTHDVMKNFAKRLFQKAVDEIGAIEQEVSDAFDGLEAKLNAWAGITDPGEAGGSMTKSRDPDDESSSPQSH
jgi:hypothetical protein